MLISMYECIWHVCVHVSVHVIIPPSYMWVLMEANKRVLDPLEL